MRCPECKTELKKDAAGSYLVDYRAHKLVCVPAPQKTVDDLTVSEKTEIARQIEVVRAIARRAGRATGRIWYAPIAYPGKYAVGRMLGSGPEEYGRLIGRLGKMQGSLSSLWNCRDRQSVTISGK